ncbi:MAG: hypothetical protein EBX81_05380 [bacterium]|nr:hypothetical protein [Candidatus Aquidulcis sp.]
MRRFEREGAAIADDSLRRSARLQVGVAKVVMVSGVGWFRLDGARQGGGRFVEATQSDELDAVVGVKVRRRRPTAQRFLEELDSFLRAA